MTESNENQLQIERLNSPPSIKSVATEEEFTDRRATLSGRLFQFFQSLHHPDFTAAIDRIEGAKEKADRLKDAIQEIGEELEEVPTISVALLGPSRHGKSTLLNALAGCPILPMSDIKPCTASIVSMKRSDEWDFKIRFITEKRLLRERKQAVSDAKDYLRRVAKRMMGDEEPDDPRYLHTTLQRFIQLFNIQPDLTPPELVQAVESAEIPPEIKNKLGHSGSPRSSDFDGMKDIVEKYLSTKDVYWTIVDTCDISGPFKNWHPNLELVDVPGTNDTDPHRTQITNSLRSKAKAVAICTSDSNLGNDIQSWLRNSSVMGDYLEATEQSRQQLFILRTKFDSYHPEVEFSEGVDDDEETEDRLYREAVANHKYQQTDSYREMFRNIASPLLPMGESVEEIAKREEMIGRINGIQVFFISALAYEAFEGRSKLQRRAANRLKEHFHDDPFATGIPELREFLTGMASDYLSRFYFEDLESRLELEVDRLVRFFRQQWTTFEAEVNGGSKAIAALVDKLDNEVIPWIDGFVEAGNRQFEDQSSASKQSLQNLLNRVREQLDEKLQIRISKWNALFWNSLRATARKKGVHTTCNGLHIDINQDIAGLFVDELSLRWTTFRDDVVSNSSDQIVDEICQSLQSQLDTAASDVDIPEATAAIDSIVTNLNTVARSQRNLFKKQVDNAIQELESIRKPAYDTVRELLRSTYKRIENEGGTGCQQRMRSILAQGAARKINEMWDRVESMVLKSVESLLSRTSNSILEFGSKASGELTSTARHLREVGKYANRERLLEQMEWIRRAALLLWGAVKEANQVHIELQPEPTPPAQPIAIEFKDVTEDEDIEGRNDTSQNGFNDVGAPPVIDEPQTPSESGSDSETHGNEETGTDADLEFSAPEIQVATLSDIAKAITESELYQSQKSNSNRSDVADELAAKVVTALEQNGWKMTIPALGEAVGMPTFRLRGALSIIQRILNVDGQQLVTTCRRSDTIELNESLLMQEFFT